MTMATLRNNSGQAQQNSERHPTLVHWKKAGERHTAQIVSTVSQYTHSFVYSVHSLARSIIWLAVL